MNKVLIIAEAGVNHNGDFELAKKLVRIAADSGVDIVKFQTFKAEKLVTSKAKKADYQIANTSNNDVSQLEMLKNLELTEEQHFQLRDYCKELNIEFLSTAFDIESLHFLYKLGIRLFKVPSGEITNLPYLQAIGKLKGKVILSTGMCNLGDIENAIKVLLDSGTLRSDIIVLHCNTEYPTPYSDVNLYAMNTIKTAFGVDVGYSDHTEGIEVPIAAVALGACVIEKHFTIDRNMPGPDHMASLEPDELKAMVKSIRNIEMSLGNALKTPSPSEIKNMHAARKSIHIAKDLPVNHILVYEDLIIKRPGDGISPMLIEQIVGRKLTRSLFIDQKLRWQDFQ